MVLGAWVVCGVRWFLWCGASRVCTFFLACGFSDLADLDLVFFFFMYMKRLFSAISVLRQGLPELVPRRVGEARVGGPTSTWWGSQAHNKGDEAEAEGRQEQRSEETTSEPQSQ